MRLRIDWWLVFSLVALTLYCYLLSHPPVWR